MANNIKINETQIIKLVNLIIKDKVDKAMESHVKPMVKNTVMQFSTSAKNSSGKTQTLNLGKSENIIVNYDKSKSVLTAMNTTPAHSVFKTPFIINDERLLSFWVNSGSIPVLWGSPDSENPSPLLKGRVEKYKNPIELTNGRLLTYHFKAVPFIEQAKNNLQANNHYKIKEALIKGLKANGLNVKN